MSEYRKRLHTTSLMRHDAPVTAAARQLGEILIHYPEIKGVHPACAAVPPMSEEEFTALVADVKVHGLLKPIMLTDDGLLLDGRYRLLACHEAGVETRYDRTGVEPWAYVCSMNLMREHLDVGQKAIFALAMQEHNPTAQTDESPAYSLPNLPLANKSATCPSCKSKRVKLLLIDSMCLACGHRFETDYRP